jgi:hypothetical protein
VVIDHDNHWGGGSNNTNVDKLVAELKKTDAHDRISVRHVAFVANGNDYGPNLNVMRPKVEKAFEDVMDEAIDRARGNIAIPASEYTRQLETALRDLRTQGRKK